MRGGRLLLLAALAALPGCNLLVVGHLIAPDGAPAAAGQAVVGPRVFALPPLDPATVAAATKVADAPPAEALPAEPAPAPREHEVELVGRAMVATGADDIVNVRDGLITGTPVVAVDARSGRKLAEGVTYFDGSFKLEIRFQASKIQAVVSTELLGKSDPADRTVLSAPVELRASDHEKRIAITPGTTALTTFLRFIAAGVANAANPLPADPPDLAALVGPRFGSLIAGVEDHERDDFVRLAEASAELREARSVAAIREGVDKFVSRLAVAGAGR